jgi:hypothetical protein
MSAESIAEGDLPTEKKAEIQGATIWFRIHGLLERMQQLQQLLQLMMSQRHRGDDKLREVEETLERESPWPVGHYYERGEGPRDGWQKWILGIVSAVLVGMLSWVLGKLDTLTQEVATLQATQTVSLSAINQRQNATDERLGRIEGHVYRANP